MSHSTNNLPNSSHSEGTERPPIAYSQKAKDKLKAIVYEVTEDLGSLASGYAKLEDVDNISVKHVTRARLQLAPPPPQKRLWETRRKKVSYLIGAGLFGVLLKESVFILFGNSQGFPFIPTVTLCAICGFGLWYGLSE